MMTVMTLLFSLLGLGVLICIHEFGHLIAAKMVKMRVEAFGIGFGKPICTFKVCDVVVHIGWIPFGGFVKIAGMGESGDDKTPEPDGFFMKSPFARIWVALAGPLANIIFCILVFVLIWIGGGRAKPFSFGTNRIGLLDPKSELYVEGVRAGDRIVSYAGQPVISSKDHLRSAMTTSGAIDVEVESLETGKVRSIHTAAYTQETPTKTELKTFGVLAPSSFLVWGAQGPVGTKAEPQEHGFRLGDRLVWINGENIFSLQQLREALNKDTVYLSVMRAGSLIHVSVPRCQLSDMKLTAGVRGEITDWVYEAKIEKTKLATLFFIPFNITPDCVVEEPLDYLNKNDARASEKNRLRPKDKIVAVSGAPVSKAFEIVKLVQHPAAVVIVERGLSYKKSLPLQELDQLFIRPYRSEELSKMVRDLGIEKNQDIQDESAVHLIVLRNVPLFTKDELKSTPIPSRALDDKELYLGLIGIQDMNLRYNPSPQSEMQALFEEVSSTLYALFSGAISPKWMSGPIGIVQLIQQQWAVGFFDVLFWLGAISFNLALLNLLPLPILDGGYILMALFEICTFRKISPKISGKLVAPFAFLLFGLLLYLTYHDIVRLIQHMTSH